MTDLDALWLARLQAVGNRAAHELKDALNGAVLNVEVARSRSGRADAVVPEIAPFAAAAAEQLETLARRVEALLFLTRPAAEPADVCLNLRHLAELLVPAARADGGTLEVDLSGAPAAAPSRAGGTAVRLALATGLLAVSGKGISGRCRLESGANPVVRFSHESAGACELDPATAAALAGRSIRSERSGNDLILVFPGST